MAAKKKDYAATRAALLADLDGLRVEVDAEKRVGHLILDRAPLNIVSFKGRKQIQAIIESFDEDEDVGVIVIRGANGVFTSGGDVKSFPDIPKNKMSDLADNIAAAERCAKPVIAALEKYCFGVGFELALACDFRLATKDCLIALPEITIGQMPGSGGSVRVARIAGLTRAKDLVMLGKRIPATLGKDYGLISEVADGSDGLTRLVEDYCAQLNAMAPISLRALKRVLNSAYNTSLHVALEVEGHSYEKLRATEDYMEGIKAFVEKRKANYKGR